MPGAVAVPAFIGIKAGIKELTPKIETPNIPNTVEAAKAEEAKNRARGRAAAADKLRDKKGLSANILTSPLGARNGASFLANQFASRLLGG